MRKRFEQQLIIGATPISETKFPLRSRDEDNVSLIDEELLFEINDLVVKHGQLLFKKKEKEELELRLKTDSFALKTNVHFPTDLNLLWNSVRKCFDMIKIIQEQDSTLIGWRKIKELRKLFKAQFRSTSQQVFKGKNAEQKMASVKAYLALASQMQKRFSEMFSDHASPSILLSLHSYNGYVAKFIDQIERRLLKNEVIPSEEKMYSIFEQHTEWLNKGKSNPGV